MQTIIPPIQFKATGSEVNNLQQALLIIVDKKNYQHLPGTKHTYSGGFSVVVKNAPAGNGNILLWRRHKKPCASLSNSAKPRR